MIVGFILKIPPVIIHFIKTGLPILLFMVSGDFIIFISYFRPTLCVIKIVTLKGDIKKKKKKKTF